MVIRMGLEFWPDDADLFNLLGAVAFQIGCIPEARDLFAKAVALAPDWPMPAANLRAMGALGSPFQPVTRPGTGQRFLVIKAWGCGFWSDVDHVLGQLLLAEITGRAPAIDWGKGSRFSPRDGRDAWTLFFQPVSSVSVFDLLPMAVSGDSVFPPKWTGAMLGRKEINRFSGEGSRLSGLALLNRPESIVVSDYHTSVKTLSFWIPKDHHLHGRTVPDIYRYLCETYLRPEASIAIEVERFRTVHFPNRRTLAVHVRGTDKAAEMSSLAELNQRALLEARKFADETGADAIFLATDESAVVSSFHEVFGERLITTQATRTSGSIGLHSRSDLRGDALGREVLIDTLLMSSADAFLGNGRSNVSAMVEHLKDWPEGCLQLMEKSIHYELNTFLTPP